MQKLKDLLKSRKFWAAIIALGLILARAYLDLPFTDQQVADFCFVVIAYILGTSLESMRYPPA